MTNTSLTALTKAVVGKLDQKSSVDASDMMHAMRQEEHDVRRGGGQGLNHQEAAREEQEYDKKTVPSTWLFEVSEDCD